MQPMGFTGFSIRCHAIKWGAWFGAAERKYGGKIKDVDYESFDEMMADDGPSVRGLRTQVAQPSDEDLEMSEEEAREFAIEDSGF